MGNDSDSESDPGTYSESVNNSGNFNESDEEIVSDEETGSDEETRSDLERLIRDNERLNRAVAEDALNEFYNRGYDLSDDEHANDGWTDDDYHYPYSYHHMICDEVLNSRITIEDIGVRITYSRKL